MNQQERSIAGLVHLSIVLPLWGPIIALIIWLNNRNKYKFIAFHSLQSLFYQLAIYGVLIVGGIFHLILKFLLWIKFPLADMFVSINMYLLLLIYFIALLYAIYACFTIISGSEFNYFVIGKRLQESDTEVEEDYFSKEGE